MSRFDIRRQIQELDSVLGGVTITSTAIETREVDFACYEFFVFFSFYD